MIAIVRCYMIERNQSGKTSVDETGHITITYGDSGEYSPQDLGDRLTLPIFWYQHDAWYWIITICMTLTIIWLSLGYAPTIFGSTSYLNNIGPIAMCIGGVAGLLWYNLKYSNQEPHHANDYLLAPLASLGGIIASIILLFVAIIAIIIVIVIGVIAVWAGG